MGCLPPVPPRPPPSPLSTTISTIGSSRRPRACADGAKIHRSIWFSEFGTDGGPAAKSLKPKFNLFVKQVSASVGMAVPHIDIKTVIAFTMFLKAFGGLLFIISSSFGAVVLLVYLAFITPVVYDFYNYEMESQQFVKLFTLFSQNVALFGALLFFLGMKNSIPRRHSKRRAAKAKTT